MPDDQVHTLFFESLRDVAPEDWDNLVGPENPFLRHAFLSALEESGCVGPKTAWSPEHALLFRGDQLWAAVPAYAKADSFGEYIFDHAWADAFHRVGLAYYPKSLVAVPFTPANGRRFLSAQSDDPEAVRRLAEALQRRAIKQAQSSVHVLFLTLEEAQILESAGFRTRVSTQYHWFNHDYKSFDAYLEELRSQKRKQIRRERRAISESGLEILELTGNDIEPGHMQAMWRFYQDTGSRKWGRPYLNRAWFENIRQAFAENTLLFLARRPGKEYVAGTLNFLGKDRLFGRYWGATEHVPFLHFELCYYRPIEYAIRSGRLLFEAGAQGEHKFLRGFETVPCYSSHWFAHPEGQRAIGDFLAAEAEQVRAGIVHMNSFSPLKTLRSSGVQK